MVQILQKLLHILNKDQKRKVAGLGVMIFIGALMEMIGVGLIMPVVEGVMAPDQLLNKWYIQILERWIHFDTPNQWLLFLIGVIIAVYFIKNGYLLLQTYVQSRFVNTNQSNTISYMLEEYLNRPYEFYLNADIPTIFRTIDGDVPKVFTTLMEYIQLATELMVSAVLCVTLLVTNPTMTIFIVVVMGGTTVVILKILKPTLNRLGRTSQRLQSQMGKWRLQSIYGIKDVKILNKEHYFASSFGKYSQENAKLTTEYAVLNNMPRLLLETLSICGILGYLAICILNSADMTELVPQISAFAVAAMRLMPSVNRINTHMSNIAFYEPSVNYVYENVDFTSYRLHGKYEKDYDPHTPPMELKKEIRMEDVSYTYPESDKVILDHAQMLVPVGKSVGVMGPSGAGKSTAIDILMGLLQVQGGEILCDGRNIFENISETVDMIFSNYLSRPGVLQPILTQYCDGRRVSCPNWMSQWGSKDLGEQGYSPIEILRYYYGDDIYINSAEQISGIPSSWPGYNLTIGSSGQKVQQIQEQLNRISDNYPAIPKIAADGIYGNQTAEAVRTFQKIFNLPQTGVTDYATWYKISQIYVGVSRIAELN